MSIKISALPVATSAAPTDLVPIVQGTTTRQATAQILVSGAVMALSTTLPATAGVLWNNGGSLDISQP